jgi:hypothetical protein
MREERTRRLHLDVRHLLAMVARLATVLAIIALPGVARAHSDAATRVVRYDGVHITVPSGWPVLRVDARSMTCVRFDRHAVYLGIPGVNQICPLGAAGRTESILVSPAGAAPALPAVTAAGGGGGSMARLTEGPRRARVTVTWNRDPRTVRRALGLRSLRPSRTIAGSGSAGSRDDVGLSDLRPSIVSATSPAIPASVYTGLGFDTCSAPSQSALSAWSTTSPYGAVGIYIGGTNMACSQSNLSSAWVSAESAAGWHLVPLYVGLQAAGNSCGCAAISPVSAAGQGTAAAEDAATQATTLGIGTGNPIYYDMEGYPRSSSVTAAVLTFLQAWTTQLHAEGYRSGVYSSGSSGIAALVAANVAGYTEPDDIWVADWNNEQTVTDPYVPDGFWVSDQRLHQYEGGHNESYGGVTLNIDGDYIDALTAAFGSGIPQTVASTPPVATTTSTTPVVTTTTATSTTPPRPPTVPALKATPRVDGTIDVTPSWKGEQGISAYRILAGNTRTALVTVGTVWPRHAPALNVDGIYSYFQVQALNSSGTVLGSSPAIPTTSGVAIFGNSAFVPAGGTVGVPVACVHTAPCRLRAALYSGGRRMTSTGTETVAQHGGFVRLKLSRRGYRQVKRGALPVKVTVTGAAGVEASRNLKLRAYTVSGRAPFRRTGASSALQILSRTDYVSDGRVGGVLVACTLDTPCRATTRVTTRAGAVIARVRTQTLGSGRLGYLSFTLNARGHALLRAAPGNQLAARVRVTVAPPTDSAPGGTPAAGGSGRTTTSLASLTSFG